MVRAKRAPDFWLLASGFWLLASGFWLLASAFWLLTSDSSSPLSSRSSEVDPLSPGAATTRSFTSI
jgi:hypothetical protein